MTNPALVSKSQIARLNTEAWVSRHGFCLACESNLLTPTRSNTPARDFECPRCGHAYELKASAKQFRSKVVDGAFVTMMKRIQDKTVASFLLMRYTDGWDVSDLSVIHHSLITSAMIEERKPLAPTARRAGWIGCNILLGKVPPEGRISIFNDGIQLPRSEPRTQFQRAERLADKPLSSRGWTAALLLKLHALSSASFSLDDAYSFVPELQNEFPKNSHVREKIRQQLQVLRDAGMISFDARGRYTLLNRQEVGS